MGFFRSLSNARLHISNSCGWCNDTGVNERDVNSQKSQFEHMS